MTADPMRCTRQVASRSANVRARGAVASCCCIRVEPLSKASPPCRARGGDDERRRSGALGVAVVAARIVVVATVVRATVGFPLARFVVEIVAIGVPIVAAQAVLLLRIRLTGRAREAQVVVDVLLFGRLGWTQRATWWRAASARHGDARPPLR